MILGLLILASSLFGGEINDFDQLMGKSTAHWNYVAQSQDIDMLERAKTLYEKNQSAQFISEGPYKIPPVVHFIWLGPRPFPPQSVENVRTWIALNPGWKVKFWTDRDREPPCEGMEKVFVQDFPFLKLGGCYEDSQNWAEKSDVLRFEILYQEGGVYADHDANCLRPFSSMHRGYDFFCGFEAPHEPFVGRNITCGNGVIGSRPGHPTVARVIDLIAENWDALGEKFRGKDPYSRIEVVMQRTYIALTNALEGTINRDGNVDIILPAAYFFSKSGIAPIYSKHFYDTTWDDFRSRKTDMEHFNEKTLRKIEHKTRTLSFVLIGLFFLNGLCFALLKRRKTV